MQRFGHNGLGEMNETGEMFADLLCIKQICYIYVRGHVLPHRRTHMATRISPDHRSENQTDYICIGQTFRPSLLDVRVYQEVDAASDHHFVLPKIKMMLTRVWVTWSTRHSYNMGFLKDRNVLDRFHLSLNHRYQVLQKIIMIDH